MELNKRLLQKVAGYKPNAQALQNILSTPVVFTVGIVGAGKNVVQRELTKRFPDQYQFIVSHVTRSPRSNEGLMEREGVEYYFIDFPTAERMLDAGQYVEANIIHYEDIYGTGIAEIERIQKQHKIGITDLDIKGVQKYVDLGMNVKPVFLVPPNYKIWWERMIKRYGDAIDWHDVHKRMKTALDELQFVLDRDYFYLVINDDFEETVAMTNRIAHGENIPRRDPAALAVVHQLAADISDKLAHWNHRQ